MSGIARLGAIFREAIATARSQKSASIISIVMVAGMCATVLLTTGRTVAAEDQVLKTFDSSGTTSIFIRAQGDSGLDTTVLDRIDRLEGISWVGAFSAAQDATNVDISGGTNVPVRFGYGSDLRKLGMTPGSDGVQKAWASATALQQLGMPDSVGGIRLDSGASYALVGNLHLPDYLGELEPAVIIPISSPRVLPVALVAIKVSRPDLVAPTARALQSLVQVSDPSKVTIATSENLAAVRAVVAGQLGSFGRGLVIVIFAITGGLVAAILYGLVTMRRKDFGRRRALGATRGLIVTLLLGQMAALSAVGALLGTLAALIPLIAAHDPLPDIGFTTAVDVLAVGVGILAALAPAVSAARKDPLRELRVP